MLTGRHCATGLPRRALLMTGPARSAPARSISPISTSATSTWRILGWYIRSKREVGKPTLLFAAGGGERFAGEDVEIGGAKGVGGLIGDEQAEMAGAAGVVGNRDLGGELAAGQFQGPAGVAAIE